MTSCRIPILAMYKACQITSINGVLFTLDTPGLLEDEQQDKFKS